ncbi:hypothetical protein HPB52_018719 [Rhipicephalus sanguineus]|uniref:Myb/SANT-like DNA-binding domain-containing protein 3 n=1 Tax=Rhipicephalus sanguineus TaxID=34632 RepID=A0A9D4PG50_RHISA|nr:hypothetical protein HPB52_018719 [Rhipicephalus sanguineus]
MERRAKVNFTDEERGVLTDLVNKYREVLENKRTDAVSLQRKQRTWDQLASEFNSRQNVHPRTAKQLKKCWDNLKEKWRRAKADDTREPSTPGNVISRQLQLKRRNQARTTPVQPSRALWLREQFLKKSQQVEAGHPAQ